jgi:hypothetical protein
LPVYAANMLIMDLSEHMSSHNILCARQKIIDPPLMHIFRMGLVVC